MEIYADEIKLSFTSDRYCGGDKLHELLKEAFPEKAFNVTDVDAVLCLVMQELLDRRKDVLK